MPRFFNTTGPCDPADHYMLAPEDRIPDLWPFVAEKLYFVIHAARQTGKTTAMRAFAAKLRERGFAGLWATLEQGQGVTEVARAEPIWLRSLHHAGLALPEAWQPPAPEPWIASEESTRLFRYLAAWAAACPVPIVLLLDEADTASGPALVSLLRQLRAGWANSR